MFDCMKTDSHVSLKPNEYPWFHKYDNILEECGSLLSHIPILQMEIEGNYVLPRLPLSSTWSLPGTNRKEELLG